MIRDQIVYLRVVSRIGRIVLTLTVDMEEGSVVVVVAAIIVS
jgi:hypothetical protein